MSSAEERKGRRGAGRGRRTGPSGQQQQEAPGRGGESRPEGTQTPVGSGRGRGRGDLEEKASPEQERVSSEGGSPKETTPPHSDTETVDKMKQLQLIDLAQRPGFGVVGNKIKVFANHFEVRLNKDLTVVQYHVDVDHERMRLTRDEKHQAFYTCVSRHPQVFGNPVHMAFDGEHICIALDKFKFSNGEALGNFEEMMRLMRMEKSEKIRVKLTLVGLVSVNLREARTTGAASDRYTTPLHILDLIFRQGRSYPLSEQMVNKWYSFSSTVYRIPHRDGGVDLTCGRVIWQGLFGAARVGQNFISYINFDVSHTGFYRNLPVLDFLVEILNANFGRRGAGFELKQLNNTSSLSLEWRQAFDRAIRGLKVRMEVNKHNGEKLERDYNVNGVFDQDALTYKFEKTETDGRKRMINVAEYFNERYGQLKYPKLQLLHVGSKTRKTYLPMEHCTLVNRQRVKKLTPEDTSRMIKAAAINAPSRKGKIDELVSESNFANDPWLRAFGIQVNSNMKQVDARILPSPKIRYAQVQGGRQPIVEVREGTWDMRGQKFIMPAGCPDQEIGALVMDDRDFDGYSGFFRFLLTTCKELGMNVPTQINQQRIRAIGPNDIQGIEKAMTELHKMGVKFIICTMPQKSTPHYSEFKRVAEIVLGVMTQCVVKTNIVKCMSKNDKMTTANLALKINHKLGGINWKAELDSFAKKVLLDEPTLVMGIDVTHPSPLEKKMPSISSVVANLDDSFMRYAASVRVQKHRRESIVAGHLGTLVRQRLLEYHRFVTEENKRTGQNKPARCTRMIIFRDGVAEGQFQEILHEELSGIRQCCLDLDAKYRPKITLIVAQKRHHTRFFPMPQGPNSGRAQNVCPGTIVDMDITHPQQFEFYLCSHFGIQGTSRPIRYHVLSDDNHFTSDHIQVVTHYMCHVYARCTRTVSIPAPVYYADLACRRARAHIYDKVADFGSDTMSQRSGSGADSGTQLSENELVKASELKSALDMRMYFV